MSLRHFARGFTDETGTTPAMPRNACAGDGPQRGRRDRPPASRSYRRGWRLRRPWLRDAPPSCAASANHHRRLRRVRAAVRAHELTVTTAYTARAGDLRPGASCRTGDLMDKLLGRRLVGRRDRYRVYTSQCQPARVRPDGASLPRCPGAARGAAREPVTPGVQGRRARSPAHRAPGRGGARHGGEAA